MIEEIYKDELTGAYNRKGLKFILTDQTKKIGADYKKLAIFLLDIDKFKQINDNYGHPYGDKIINGFADIIRRTLRGSDLIARYGGDEFIFFIPYNIKNATQRIRKELKKNLHKQFFISPHGKRFHLTASGGIVIYPDDCKRGEDLLILADKALYFSKRRGGNRITSLGEIRIWRLKQISFIILTLILFLLLIPLVLNNNIISKVSKRAEVIKKSFIGKVTDYAKDIKSNLTIAEYDIIHLKDGQILRAKVIKISEKAITVELASEDPFRTKQINIDRDQIEYIEYLTESGH